MDSTPRYQWGPPPTPPEPVRSASKPSGGVRAMAIIGIVLGVLAVLYVPIVFGPLGIVLAVVAYAKGDKTVGLAALIVAPAGMIVGFVLGFLAFSANIANGGY